MGQKTYGKTARHKEKEAYVQGNTVKKLYVAEPYTNAPDLEELQEEKKQRRARQRQIHRANQINFLYTVAVTGIVAVIFTICYQYLNLQTSVKNNSSQVAQLQSQLNSLKESNDEEEVEVNASIDYNALYNTAVNDLGMVYPNKSQVITYSQGESEYVKQYQDIPSAQ